MTTDLKAPSSPAAASGPSNGVTGTPKTRKPAEARKRRPLAAMYSDLQTRVNVALMVLGGEVTGPGSTVAIAVRVLKGEVS